MKKHKTITVSQAYTHVESMSCDICGKVVEDETWAGCHELVESVVRLKEGEVYPETGWGTEIEIDVCPECFRKKLIPWLESQGVQIEEKKWHW